MTRRSLTVSVLSKCFVAVKTLKEYLNDILHTDLRNNQHGFEAQAGDPPLYNALLNNSYVGLREDNGVSIRFHMVEPIVDMREVRCILNTKCRC